MLLTFASLAVSPAETADRLSVTLTLLLTSVAFKFVVSQSLPQISYLTYLVRSKFVLCHTLFIKWKKDKEKLDHNFYNVLYI